MVVSKHTTYVNYYPDKLTVKFAEVLDNVTELIETAQLKSYRDSPRPREPSYPDWLQGRGMLTEALATPNRGSIFTR